jgi:Flp pilus assembly protein CpaB
MSAGRSSGIVSGLIVGLGASCFVGGPMGVALGRWANDRATDRDRERWQLTPVVVAAIDLTPGVPLAMPQLSQRHVPSQLVTSGAVRPDEARRVVGQSVRVEVSAGDVLQWTMFDRQQVDARCVEFATSVAKATHADREPAITQLLEGLAARAATADAGTW